MNIIEVFYNLFYNESLIDKKIDISQKEYDSLGLHSSKIDLLKEGVKNSKNKAERIKNKLRLKFEYRFSINHFFELDVW